MPTQPTQTNLKLQLDLAELVQAKGLPMWESDNYIIQYMKGDDFQIEYFRYASEDCYLIKPAIDLNQNRFSEWVDKTLPSQEKDEREDPRWGRCNLSNKDYYKINIALDGLTDTILEELIKAIKKL